MNLVGGICHLTFLGNTHVAPSVTSCGFDPSSAEGKTFSVLKISCTDNVVTVTASEAHDLIQGQAAVLSGLIDPSFEAPPVTITVCSSTGTWKMRTVLKSWEPRLSRLEEQETTDRMPPPASHGPKSGRGIRTYARSIIIFMQCILTVERY